MGQASWGALKCGRRLRPQPDQGSEKASGGQIEKHIQWARFRSCSSSFFIHADCASMCMDPFAGCRPPPSRWLQHMRGWHVVWIFPPPAGVGCRKYTLRFAQAITPGLKGNRIIHHEFALPAQGVFGDHFVPIVSHFWTKVTGGPRTLSISIKSCGLLCAVWPQCRHGR